MFLWWRPDFIQFYNDSYRPSFGEKGRHPTALGMPGADCWTDIWQTISPQIEQVMTTGVSTWHVDQYLPIERNGQLEEVWWAYSDSPAFDDDGSLAGTLVVCLEATQRVFADREYVRLVSELEAERARLEDTFRQSPSFLAVLRGADNTFEFVIALERVFQPFVQLDVKLTRKGEGTGLGLAISRDLAGGMGGDLKAESEPGIGSTFILTPPMRQEEFDSDACLLFSSR